MSQGTAPARNNWIIFGLFIVTLALGGFVTLRYELANNRLQNVAAIQNQQMRLLQDQLREYEFKLLSAPTYDQGYKDAIVKIQAGTFQDGYVAAEKIYKTGSYADGYHNAIEQFGNGWLTDKDRETLKNVSNVENESSP